MQNAECRMVVSQLADFCTLALTVAIILMILVVIAGAFGVPNALERIAKALERIADALEGKKDG